MPILLSLGAGSAQSAEVELKNESGRITFGGSLSDPDTIGVEFWDGTQYVTLFKNGVALVAEDTNNMQLIDGPGRYRLNKPSAGTLVVYIGTDSNARVIDIT